ncbi:PREDICTED: E3 ubiquitin-protein ligase MBR2-like [Populus euphratica]|uniref:RING-type E3 ubiquitin transferase n=1 Tax=Populus euphratica TaxID=75702 RepID=A0AAJ6V8I3_POPEU|nr:PREDICTED: E3 ubiquitin-protein ligase MBR2-like [Populus euphratica]
MAGQGSKSNAFPGKFYLGYGPNGINLLCNQNVDSEDSSSEGTHSELNIAPSDNNSQLTNSNGPSATMEASPSVLPRNIDLNAAYEGNRMGDTQELGGGSDPNKNMLVSDSSTSNAIMISSGIAGYVLEENEGAQDSASGGRRLSCKRRAPEDASRQFSLGESSRSVKLGDIPEENAPKSFILPSSLNSNPNSARLSVGVRIAPSLYQPSGAAASEFATGAGTSSEMHQNPSVVGQAENTQRYTRLRRSASRLDSAPDPNSSFWTVRNPRVQSSLQQPVFYQFNHLPSSNTAATTGMVHIASPTQPFMHTPNPSQPFQWNGVTTPNPSQPLQPFQWNGVTTERTSGPSTHAMNGGNTLHQDRSLRNDPRNGVFFSEFQRTHMPHMPTNLHFANGRYFPGSMSPISQNGSTSHQPRIPIWYVQGNMEEQYHGRMPNLVNRTEPQGQICYLPFNLVASSHTTERGLQVGSGNVRPSQMPLIPGLEMRYERQTVTREMALRALTAVQRRNRLATEVRNALTLVRRRGSLQFGNVMLIDRSALFGDSDDEEADELEDMRLDVDNMSYEQLLALEEQMGNVSTGLSEDAIVATLKHWKYQAVVDGSDSEDEPCCICQEAYADEDDLGKLKCGHDFHFNCIKRWLVEKNTCPICKKAAMDV